VLDPIQFGKDMGELIREAVAPLKQQIADQQKRIDELQARKPEPGPKGEDGKDADPVEITHEDIAKALREDPSLLRDVVTEYLKAHPPKDGEDGKDGIGLTGFLVNRDGHLVGTTSDGKCHDLGQVVGKDGASWEGASIDFDGEKSLILRAKDGTEQLIKTSLPRDKGYWRDGMTVEKGDFVTHDGCLWVAQKDTNDRPGYKKDAWRMAVRKGRDGTTSVKYKDDPSKPVKLQGKTDD